MRRETRDWKPVAYWIGLAVLCVIVRTIDLGVDPPPWLSWSNGIYTDEGFYTLDARHLAVFGTFAPGNFHDRLLSPLLSGTQYLVFRAFGAGWIPARSISAAFGLLTIFIFAAGLHVAYGRRAAVFGALFLGLSPWVVLYNRMALQETPAAFWLVLAFVLFCIGLTHRRGIPCLAAAGAAVAVAAVFKPLALIAVPGFIAAALGPRAKEGFTVSPLTAFAAAFVGVLCLYALLWLRPHHAELERMNAYYWERQIAPHSLGDVGRNLWRSFAGRDKGLFFCLAVFLPAPLALALHALTTKRSWAGPDRLLAVWLLTGCLFCMLSSYAPSRYYILFMPAIVGLAARSAGRLDRRLAAIAVAGFVLVSGYWLGRAWAQRQGNMRAAGVLLQRALPAGATVVGEFAPALCLGTRLKAAPVQPGLSNDAMPAETLRAAGVLVTDAPYWHRWWLGHDPRCVGGRPLEEFVIGGTREIQVEFYRVKD